MDTLKFTCQNCGGHILADLDMCGDTIDCPHCSNTIMVPMPGIRPGMHITRYKIIRRIGIGGMGEVWLARHSSMDRLVALKILSPALVRNQIFVKRFFHEAKLAGQLVHPNIVMAFDAGVEQGVYYLASAYIEGITLERLIRQKERIPEEKALQFTLQIARALNYAWRSQRILHRDIKPGNIMIDLDDRALMMDLGISKRLEENDPLLTHSGQFVGTPYYTSPEQASSSENVDFRADIYSLGVTLFHMVTGRVPFKTDHTAEILEMHLSKPPPSPQDINPLVSNACCALIEIMISKSRMQRQSSWEMVVEDVEEVLNGRFPQTPSPSGSRYIVMRKLLQQLQTPASKKGNPQPLSWDGISLRRKIPRWSSGALLACLLVLAFIFIPRPGIDDEVQEAVKDPMQLERHPDWEQVQREIWRSTVQFISLLENQPEMLGTMIAELERINNLLEGSVYATRTETEIERLRNLKESKIAAILHDLDNEAEREAGNDRLLVAASLYEDYEGAFTQQIRSRRAGRVDALRQEFAEQEREREQRRAAIESARRQIAILLAEGKINEAFFVTQMDDYAELLPEEQSLLAVLTKHRELMIDGLQARIGRSINLVINGEQRSLRLHDVRNGSVFVEERVSAGMVVREYSLQHLPEEERFAALASAGVHPSALALLRGVKASVRGDYIRALNHFRQIDSLAPYLEEQIKALQRQSQLESPESLPQTR